MDLPPPAIDFAHRYYGGLAMDAKEIVFNNAVEDPWQYAGMQSLEYPDYQYKMVANLINCTDCAHCIDIHEIQADDPEILTAIRIDTQNHIKKWLGWYN